MKIEKSQMFVCEYPWVNAQCPAGPQFRTGSWQRCACRLLRHCGSRLACCLKSAFWIACVEFEGIEDDQSLRLSRRGVMIYESVFTSIFCTKDLTYRICACTRRHGDLAGERKVEQAVLDGKTHGRVKPCENFLDRHQEQRAGEWSKPEMSSLIQSVTQVRG
eukprot:625576-Hanusia_phi.AAC.1